MQKEPPSSKSKKSRRNPGIPETEDWSDKYDHLRDEYKNEQQIQRGKEFIDEFVKLYGKPGDKTKQWNNVLRKQEVKYEPHEKAPKPIILENDSEEDEEKEDFDRDEYEKTDAKLQSTYILNNGSTVGMPKKGVRFAPMAQLGPASKQKAIAPNTQLAMPIARDDEFDTWLCKANKQQIAAFKDDARCSQKFMRTSSALERMKGSPFSDAVRMAKRVSGHLNDQTFFGSSPLISFEVSVLVNNDVRLVLIGYEDRFLNFCIKEPEFM